METICRRHPICFLRNNIAPAPVAITKMRYLRLRGMTKVNAAFDLYPINDIQSTDTITHKMYRFIWIKFMHIFIFNTSM